MARPRGSVNRNKFDVRVLDDMKSKSSRIVAGLISDALDGDTQAAKIILDKLLPNLKPESKPLKFELDERGTLSQQASSILLACSNGNISHEAASSLINSLSGLMKIKEVEELEARLKALEESIDNDS